MYKILIIMIVFTTPAIGQSVMIAPESFSFWGRTNNVTVIEAEYKIRAVLFINRTTKADPYSAQTKTVYGGIFVPLVDFSPLTIETGILLPKFPTKNGANLNFRIAINIPIKRLEVSYIHYSNGYLSRVNTGLDTIGISYRF